MIAATKSKKKADAITNRMREIQESWSPLQRTERLIDGYRRRAEFGRLIAVPSPQVEIWAAGALDFADLKRLAG